MRFVDRSKVPAPAFLTGHKVALMRDRYLKFLSLDPRQRAQTRPPDRHLPPDTELDEALVRLFRGKCAFCEGRGRLLTYRFRPTSEALPLDTNDPEAHLAYGWLADVWQNLYPICAGCRPSQPNQFPVDGPRQPIPTLAEYSRFVASGTADWSLPIEEESRLLDPCRDRDITSHLVPAPDGVLIALSRRGNSTIDVYQLNRPDLIERRRAAFDFARDAFMTESAEARALESEEFGGLIQTLMTDPAMRDMVARPGRRKPAKQTPGKAARDVETATGWRLTDIAIENFKSLERLDIRMPEPPAPDLVDDYKTAALLILGENASGKSTILEALALALVDDAARDRVLKGADISADKLLLNPRFMGDADMASRLTGSIRLRFLDAAGQQRERVLKLSPEGFNTEGEDLPGLPVFAYGAFRHYRDDYRNWSPERGIINLFRSDNLLSKPDRWLLTLTEREFDLVVGVLREIFGAAGSFKFIERDFAGNQCLVVAEQADGIITRTPLYSVSSGFRTILALTCDVMRWLMDNNRPWSFPTLTMARGIVLIDEVEAHLHPRWKVQVMGGLRRALKNMTFIVTTHDPLCLRGMRDGEVMVLQRIPGLAAGSDLPILVESLTELPNVSQLTIEQLLSSQFFDLFNTDDPRIGHAMAELADALVAVRRGETPDRNAALTLAHFRSEINSALPVGRSDVARLVQEAVAEYVIARRGAAAGKQQKLRDDTRNLIIDLLGRA